MHGYVLIVGNTIEHLPLTSLRVIRGKSLLRINVPEFAVTTRTTPRTTTTAAQSNYIYHDDDGDGLGTGVWNVSKVHENVEWKNVSVEEEQVDAESTASDSGGDDQLLCSLLILSNWKKNSTSIGLREIQLTSLHGE